MIKKQVDACFFITWMFPALKIAVTPAQAGVYSTRAPSLK
jgi:hypothetical protein